VILPPLIVTLSWTLPYCVATASPVTVFAALDDDVAEGDAVGAGAAAVGIADAAWRGWNPSVAARPRAVAVRTIGARCMVVVSVRKGTRGVEHPHAP
jgi:hypothetical protein